jgi:hypothetical protein
MHGVGLVEKKPLRQAKANACVVENREHDRTWYRIMLLNAPEGVDAPDIFPVIEKSFKVSPRGHHHSLHPP